MESGITVLSQIVKMFILMGIGAFIFYKKWINESGSQQISNILLKVCSTAIMVVSFNKPFSLEKLANLFISFFIASFSICIALIIAKIVFKNKNKLEQFAVVFSNGGFIGIPLVQSLMGTEYIFYLSAWLLAFNIFAWTVGVYMISGRRDLITFKVILKSPAMIGLALGLLVFISPIKLHPLILHPVAMIGDMNTPLAMIILGTYVAKSDITKVFSNKTAYLVSFLRLIVVPLITIFIFLLIPQTYYDIKKVVIIAASAPTAVMVAMLAQQYDGDFEFGAQIVSLSTILCIVTVPIMLLIAETVW